MFTQPRRRILALSLPFVVALVSAVSAHAQTVATNFDELRLKVKAGDTVYVIEGNGEERRARVLELAPSSLAVSIFNRWPSRPNSRRERSRCQPVET